MSQHFEQFRSTHLNEQQHQAVTPGLGVLLVIAGAGSGKTRVITTRIVNLIVEHGAQPQSIVALTFTNKAANEMKERIKRFLPNAPVLPYIGTFHSYCLYLLKRNAHLLTNPAFSIMDADDQIKLVQLLIKRSGLDKQVNAKNVLHTISALKNTGAIKADQHKQLQNSQLVLQLYQAYEQEKRLANCFDFDDLLVQGYQLFEKHKAFKQQHQQAVRHILIDEYQDTNLLQHALLKQMALNDNQRAVDSVCAVGDEDQSIYSWRGATVTNMLNFKKDFPETNTITIAQNYRSVDAILAVANSVIACNKERNPKELWSNREAKDRVRIIRCLSGYQEGDLVTTFLHARGSKPLKECALLYRAHYNSRVLEEALIRASIPYRIIGGIQFYERKEIKDMLAYLRLVVNPFDRIALMRIINTPARGLGVKFEQLLLQTWHEQPMLTFEQLLKLLIEQKEVPPAKSNSITSFLELFTGLSAHDKPSVILEQLINAINYLTYLKTSFDQQEAEAKIENIKELIRATKHFEQIGLTTIELFLQEVALMQEHTLNQNVEDDYVQLMTIHAAKGLEFDTVVLTGLEDGSFPNSHAVYEQTRLEEERRLFYVAITRARERLLLTTARYRMSYGQMNEHMPSRFLRDIPERTAQSYDAMNSDQDELLRYFNQWLGQKQPPKEISYKKSDATTRSKRIVEMRVQPAQKDGKDASPAWKMHQPVKHKTYGVGVIKKIQQKAHTCYLTIAFKKGTKTIQDRFVEST